MSEKSPEKHIVLIQNTEVGGHLALSTFLTGLLRRYKKKEGLVYSLICGYVDKESEIGDMRGNMSMYEMKTAYNKITDNILFTIRAFRQLLQIHAQKKIDVIHALYPNSSLQVAVLFKICVSRKTRIIYDVRSPRIEMSFANAHIHKAKLFFKWLMHLSEYILIKWVNYFVFITKGTQEYYKQKYAMPEMATTILPTGVDIAKFSLELTEQEKLSLRERLGIGKDDIVIGYVGAISGMRKMSEFISAEATKIKASPHIKFLMIGDGDTVGSMQDLVSESGIAAQFIFTGKMKQSELIPYMHIFDYGWCHLPDIFVYRNSFPLKILEYLSIGIHILASDIKTHKQIQEEFSEQITIYDADGINYTSLSQQGHVVNPHIFGYDRNVLVKTYNDIYLQL